MKSKILFYSFFIFVFLLFQTTLLQYAAIYGTMPNILMVFIIVTSLIRGNIEGSIAGFFAGLAIDMMFGSVLGFYALLGFYLGIAAGSANRRMFRDNLLVALFFTFVYSVLYEIIVYIVNNIMGGEMELLYALSRVILPEAVYNCVTAVPIYWLVMKADKRFAGTEKMARKY